MHSLLILHIVFISLWVIVADFSNSTTDVLVAVAILKFRTVLKARPWKSEHVTIIVDKHDKIY